MTGNPIAFFQLSPLLLNGTGFAENLAGSLQNHKQKHLNCMNRSTPPLHILYLNCTFSLILLDYFIDSLPLTLLFIQFFHYSYYRAYNISLY